MADAPEGSEAPVREGQPVTPQPESGEADTEPPSDQGATAEKPQDSTLSPKQARRVAGISVKMDPSEPLRGSMVPPEPDLPPITLEELKSCWLKALDQIALSQPQAAETLRHKELRIDGENHFNIVVNSDYTSAEIKPLLVSILATLRSLSKRPLLNCSTKVEHIERESKPYTARDKYEVMSQTNPSLETFRILFPEVDL